MECVILVGGLGTRMRPATETIPKALIPVAGRPFVDRQLEWLAAEGVNRAVLSIGHKGELLREHVGNGRRFGLRVDYVDEGTELRGTGGALRLAFEQGALPGSFLVLYGDSYLPLSVRPVWEAFLASDCPALMTVLRNQDRWGRSNAHYERGRVVLYDKSATRGGPMEFIDYGLSVLSRGVVEKEIPPGEAFDLAVLFHRLSVAGQLGGFEVYERFFEVGSPAGLADFEAHLASLEGSGG
jgi:NDP-sugar pyrophosphorylase family protein